MKKFMYFAAALLVLVGCNKKENIIENAPQNLVTITGGIKIPAQDGPNKVVAKPGWETASTVEFVWEAGDEIAVMSMDPVEIKKFTVSSISQDGKTAEFTGEPLSGGMKSYMVIYPYEAMNGQDAEKTFKLNQQYTGKLKPVGVGQGNSNSFSIDNIQPIFDLSLTGSVTLGKIDYCPLQGVTQELEEVTTSISMGEGGLQLTNEPVHVTFVPSTITPSGFILKFYDTNNQLIVDKTCKQNFSTAPLNKIFSLPTLEVVGATPTHAYVDLGLPSGLKWATCNVGATKPEEYGDYFAWGETEPKENYSVDTYTYTDNPSTLPADHDAAAANWGGAWRMATYAEWDELKTKCTWVWKPLNGINGYEVEGPNKNTIFLPAAGDRNGTSLPSVGSTGLFWSSSLKENNSSRAYGFLIVQSFVVGLGEEYRYYGRSVRPVCQ